MRYYIFIPLLISLVACSNSDESTSSDGIKVYSEGKEIYDRSCVLCHQESGLGIPELYPPLANSDYLLADKYRLIENIAFGIEGEIVVNGETYNSIMPPQVLNKEEILHVANYVLNAWNNNGGEVSLEEVESILSELK